MNQPFGFLKRNITVFLTILVFLLVSVAACNDTDNQASSQTATPTDSSPTTAAITAGLVDFPVICVDTASLKSYYQNSGGPAVQKLVFNFVWDDNKNLNPSLAVYKAKQNGEFIGYVTTLTAYNQTWPIQGVSFIGNLELTEARLKRLLLNATNRDVIFVPVKSGENGQRVTYKLIWGDCSKLPTKLVMDSLLLSADELNPCPPNQPGQGQ